MTEGFWNIHNMIAFGVWFKVGLAWTIIFSRLLLYVRYCKIFHKGDILRTSLCQSIIMKTIIENKCSFCIVILLSVYINTLGLDVIGGNLSAIVPAIYAAASILHSGDGYYPSSSNLNSSQSLHVVWRISKPHPLIATFVCLMYPICEQKHDRSNFWSWFKLRAALKLVLHWRLSLLRISW